MNYITGNGFRDKCRYQINDSGTFCIDSGIDNNLFFIKTDFIDKFKENVDFIGKSVVLITHNSDYSITEKHKSILESDRLLIWLSQNVNYEHYKLHSIPIGLSNVGYPNGDTGYFDKVIAMNIPKTKMLHCSYSICTNRDKRNACLNETGVAPNRCTDFKDYLPNLAASRFVISPEGNGIDCVRIWEALYVKTIPIVLNCHNISFYSDLPMVVLNSWKQFKDIDLGIDMYNKIWGNFDPSILTCEYYLEKYLCKNM